MNTNEMQANFVRYAQINEFYAVRCDFFADYREHICCCIFFRPEGQRRQVAYCVALYQYQYEARFACVEKELSRLLDILREMNCSADSGNWQPIDREQLHVDIAHSDNRLLWRSGYGLCRHDGDFQTTTRTAWPGVDSAF